MNCRQVRGKLNEYDLGVLPEAVGRQIEDHLASCEGCRRELAAYRRLGTALGPGPRDESSPASGPGDLWPAVRSRLRPRRPGVAWVQATWEPALAVAAAALVAVILLHGTVAPDVAPADMSFAADTQMSDEVLVAVGWQQPMSDEAALGMSLALLDSGGDGS